MKILALEPYYGGSHQAFLDGWISHSRHDWSLLTLPPRKWKYRMRHAAINFADEVNARTKAGERFDLIFCSDMLNLAEFLGLVGDPVRSLPTVAYFHENQLTYPVRHHKERDFHFPFTNFVTCLAASQIWFNSDFHQEELLEALPQFLRRLPDHQPTALALPLREKCQVMPPPIEPIPVVPAELDSPGLLAQSGGLAQPGSQVEPHGPTQLVHILWAARWEHDKNPEDFFNALEQLKSANIPFKLSVIGETFADSPVVFGSACEEFAENIVHWGFLPTRAEYIAALQAADIFVSTANHEFFGISVIEAISAGAFPLLPKRLSYPDIMQLGKDASAKKYFYGGSVNQLAKKLKDLAGLAGSELFGAKARQERAKLVERFHWTNRISPMDDALEKLL